MEEMNEQRPEWLSVKQAMTYAQEVFLRHKTTKEYEKAAGAIEYCANEEDSVAQYLLYALKVNSGDDAYASDALKWCKKAASSGYAPAQYDLSLHYLYGDGIEKDMFLAINWMESSALSGYREAARKLITLYTAGTKVRRNLPRAEYWQMVYEDPSYADENVPYPLTPKMLVIRPEDIRFKHEENPDGYVEWITFADLFKPIEQDLVIHAAKDKSFVIDAGPGTGKTYALIHRINHLVTEEELEAERIVVLSFTNAVVHEVKDRLKFLSNQRDGDRTLRNVDVRTFHSLAYQMLQFSNQAVVEGDEAWNDRQFVNLALNKITFDDCMVKGAELITAHPEMVTAWDYFIVDEIQDINHGKAAFVLAVLKACADNNVPFLFLGDSCQAIYDYLDKQNTAGETITSEDFYNEVIVLAQEKAKFYSFQINHRSTTDIQRQTEPIRKLILEQEESNFPSAVLEFRNSCKEIPLEKIKGYAAGHPDQRICLMTRSNINARRLSVELIKSGIDHTNVLSLHKDAYPKWIGQIFGGYQEQYLYRDQFIELCRKQGIGVPDSTNAWDQILETNQYTNEIMQMDRFLISLRSRELDFLMEEKQEKKQIVVSNIHRSKGLEYDYVCLDDNFISNYDKDMEEMKTLYVAVTRAKQETIRLTETNAIHGIQRDHTSNQRGRHFRTENKVKKLNYIEISADMDNGDVGPANFVVADMARAQKVIGTLKENDPVELRYNACIQRYQIIAKGTIIGEMSDWFTQCVSWKNEFGMPQKFDEIYVEGVFTYIGNPNEYRRRFEKKLKEIAPDYGKYCIWNYVAFSGLAHAVYEKNR